MPETSRILVCGYYGFANAGDEAILTTLLEDLRAAHPGAAITVLAGDPADVRGEYGVEAIHWQDVAGQVAAAESADLMVLGGGGLFQDHQSWDPASMLTPRHGNIGYYAGFALLAAMTATPLVIYAVGVGPLHTEEGRRFTRLAFERASAATVRDQASKELLADIGVDVSVIDVTADPTWRMEPASTEVVPGMLALEDAVTEGSFTIGVVTRPWSGSGWEAALAGALDALVAERDARVLFVPFQQSPWMHENDAHAALEVVRRMERADRTTIIRGGYTPAERMALLASCDLVMAMRLHGAVFGVLSGVPTVALSYDPKVRTNMELVGLGDQVIDLERLTAEGLGSLVTSARGADPERVDALRGPAAANRTLFTDVSPPPPIDGDTLAALTELAFDRIGSQARVEADLADLRHRHAMLEIAHDQSIKDRERLENQIDTLVNSRAMKVVNSYWDAREGVRELARKGVRRGPEPLRPVFQKIAGPDRAAQAAAAAVPGGDLTVRRQIEEQLTKVLADHPDIPGVVVYPPSIGWQVSLFQRPQQMALAFAKLGYLVLYGLDHINNEGIIGLHYAAPRIYLMAVPWGMTDLLEMIPEPITVSYVYNFAWTKHLKDPHVIFEHIDELEVFTAAHRLEDLHSWYDEAIVGADVVVGSARDLVAKVSGVRPDAILCPNGVDYRHFANYTPGPPPEDVADIAGGDRPVIGYYGAIAEWVDFDLIRKSATELSDYEFVFIGPEYDASVKQHLSVFDLPNVRWLGVKPYADLPAYLHVFDVATIPFLVNEVTHSVSPLKLFEYFAGGRPVVTPALRECAEYEAVLVASDADDYVAKLRQAVELRHDPEHQALLLRTARANTWEMRAGTLIDALARHRS